MTKLNVSSLFATCEKEGVRVFARNAEVWTNFCLALEVLLEAKKEPMTNWPRLKIRHLPLSKWNSCCFISYFLLILLAM